MKKTALFLGIVTAIMAMCSGCGKEIELTAVSTFSFSYSSGNMADNRTVYTFTREGNSYTASVKLTGQPEEETAFFAVDEVFAENLRQILSENAAVKWDGFSKSDKKVLDGNDFSLSFTAEDGTQINASGYMKWPKNYREVRQALDDLFGALQEQ